MNDFKDTNPLMGFKSYAIVIATLCGSLLVFLPLASKSINGAVISSNSDFPLSKITFSKEYQIALVVSIAACVPMAMNHMFFAQFDITSPTSLRYWIGRGMIISGFVLPNIYLLDKSLSGVAATLELICINYFHNCIAYGALMFCLHTGNCTVWTVPRVLGALCVHIISQILTTAWIFTLNYTLKVLMAIFNWLSVAIFLALAATWVHRLYFVKGVSFRELSLSDSSCIIFLCAWALLTIGTRVLDIYYAGEYRTSWNNYDANTVSAYFYLFTSFLLIITLVPGRYARLAALENLRILDQKNAYIRYVSHEIRTPLNAVSLGLQVLEKDLRGSLQEADKDRLETLVDASSACASAIGILTDLLNFDKIEGGKMSLELKKVPAFDILSKAISLFSGQARHKNVELIADIVPISVLMSSDYDNDDYRNSEALANIARSNNSNSLSSAIHRDRSNDTCDNNVIHDTGFTHSANNVNEDDLLSSLVFISCHDIINADEMKLGQVLNNLISNAIKFTPSGGKITIRARKRCEAAVRSKPKPGGGVLAAGGPGTGPGTATLHAGGGGRGGGLDRGGSFHGGRNGGGLLRNRSLRSVSAALGSDADVDEEDDRAFNSSNHHQKQQQQQQLPGPGQGTGPGKGVRRGSSRRPLSIPSLPRVMSSTALLSLSPSSPSSSSPPQEYLVIEVVDSGVGITVENQKKMFGEYAQFNPNELQAGGGSGLGLFIAKNIVTMHGGCINVYSAGLGTGCTFSVEIPLYKEPTKKSPFLKREASLFELMDRSSDRASIADGNSIRSIRSISTHFLPGSSARISGFSARISGSSARIAKSSARISGSSARISGSSARISGTSARISGSSAQISARIPGSSGAAVMFSLPALPSFSSSKGPAAGVGASVAGAGAGAAAGAVRRGSLLLHLPASRAVSNNESDAALDSPASGSARDHDGSARDHHNGSDNGSARDHNGLVMISDRRSSPTASFPPQTRGGPYPGRSSPALTLEKSVVGRTSRKQRAATAGTMIGLLKTEAQTQVASSGTLDEENDDTRPQLQSQLQGGSSPTFFTDSINSSNSNSNNHKDHTLRWRADQGSFESEQTAPGVGAGIAELTVLRKEEDAAETAIRTRDDINKDGEEEDVSSRCENSNEDEENDHAAGTVAVCSNTIKIANQPVSYTSPLPKERFASDGDGGGGAGLRILLVDDSALNRRMLGKLLRAYGHQTDEVEDGLQAVEKVKLTLDGASAAAVSSSKRYDAILMDSMMPNMDGPTATTQLRQLGYSGMIFGATGNAGQRDIDEFVAAGANTVLVKPIDVEQFNAAVKEHFSVKQATSSG